MHDMREFCIFMMRVMHIHDMRVSTLSRYVILHISMSEQFYEF